MEKFVFTTTMLVLASSAVGQTTTQPPGAAMTMPPATAIAQDTTKPVSIPADAPLKWVPSAVLPKGAEGAVVIGDPTKTGDIVVVRTKFPANYEVPAHTHPFTETITVISGSVGFGMNEKIDKTGPMARPGAVFLNPANHAHTVWTGDEPATIQVQYIGPGGIAFVNPADDPRKK